MQDRLNLLVNISFLNHCEFIKNKQQIKMLQASQKRLIQIFKTFLDKAIIPQIKKFEGSLLQCNKFSSLLLADTLNYNQLQAYVDNLSIWGTTSYDRLQLQNKKSEGETTDVSTFNPSKTFGGQRNFLKNFPYNDDKIDNQDQKRQIQKEQSVRQRVNQNNLNIISNLQKLLKTLEQNQNIIDNLGKDNQPQMNRNNRQTSFQNSLTISNNLSSNNNNNQNGINSISSHSYNYISQAHNANILSSQGSHHSQSHSQPHTNQTSLQYTVPHPSANYLKSYH